MLFKDLCHACRCIALCDPAKIDPDTFFLVDKHRCFIVLSLFPQFDQIRSDHGQCLLYFFLRRHPVFLRRKSPQFLEGIDCDIKRPVGLFVKCHRSPHQIGCILRHCPASASVEYCDLAVVMLRREQRVQPQDLLLRFIERCVRLLTVCADTHIGIHGKDLTAHQFVGILLLLTGRL